MYWVKRILKWETLRHYHHGKSTQWLVLFRRQKSNYMEKSTGRHAIFQVYNEHEFCNWLILAVNIATLYRNDINQWEAERRACSIISNNRHSKVSPEELARKWNIGIQTAKDTLKVTTQQGIQTAVHPMTQHMRVDHLHLHWNRLRGTWFADTLLARVKSKLGNTCANVYTQGKFTWVVPMMSQKDAGKSLIEFTDDVGIPEWLTTDGAMEFMGRHTEFIKEACHMHILLQYIQWNKAKRTKTMWQSTKSAS